MPFKDRQIMTQKECSEELGVHEHTIGRYMNRGDLEYLWIGGQRKLTRHLWEKFLESRTTSGPLEDPDDDS